jgi:hypothetical protein
MKHLSHVLNETLVIPGHAVGKAARAGDISKDVAVPMATHRRPRTESHRGIDRMRGDQDRTIPLDKVIVLMSNRSFGLPRMCQTNMLSERNS